jgi:predicted metalloprotease with PDZ domain
VKLALTLAVVITGTLTAQASPGPQPLPLPPPIPAPRDEAFPGTIQLAVDASDVERRVFKVHEDIPVPAGGAGVDLVLLYPRWLPGTHAPEGSLDRMAGLVVTAGGARLAWVRDTVDVFAFHVPVPTGARSISVDFQYLSAVARSVGPQEVGRNQLVLDWVNAFMYPAGYFTRQIQIAATLRVPDGWKVATALETASTKGAVTTFKTAPLETLGDSPVHAGRFLKRYDLTPPGDKAAVAFDITADRADLLEVKPALIELQRALVQQAYRLFGSHHYDHYDFLLALSDEVTENTTIEHHRSAEYAEPVTAFTDWDKNAAFRDLIAHEYVHSWDGKFRRPADLWTPTYNVPMRNSLLWVYEGGTQYWGELVTARAGVWSKQQALDSFAMTAAFLDAQPGRRWRPLQDTTNDEIINPRRPISWGSWQRFEDYYYEGKLIWLDADTLIREKTKGSRSLDDFAHAFFGVDNGSYVPEVYTFDDVVKTLNGVYAYDWATFLRTRLDGYGPGAPLDGIKRGGYRLVFTDTPSDYWASYEATRLKGADHSFSLGFAVDKDSNLSWVVWDSPAAKAGAIAGSKIISVDGMAFDPERLKAAIQRASTAGAAGAKDPIELVLQNGDRFLTVRIDYHGGLRYPHLERDATRPALLDDILAARKS